MPMSVRLLRPRASGTAVHPEAVDWATRVTANGGTVSTNTLAAVSKFCADIDSAGIRDRFWRLNLFCGNNLNSCLVPLYRNTSQGGAVLGFATENNGNFVGTDYVETGASGGLTGNGSTKFLDVGIAYSQFVDSFPSVHIAGYFNSRPTTGTFILQDASDQPFMLMGNWNLGSNIARHSIAVRINDVPGDTLPSRPGMRIMSRTSSTSAFTRRTGAADLTASATASVSSWSPYRNLTLTIFRRQIQTNAHDAYGDARCCGYSVGLSLTTSQATSYLNAMQAFQETLGRQA